MNHYIVTTQSSQRFLVQASTAEQAIQSVQQPRKILCGWTNTPVLEEPGLPVKSCANISNNHLNCRTRKI